MRRTHVNSWQAQPAWSQIDCHQTTRLGYNSRSSKLTGLSYGCRNLASLRSRFQIAARHYSNVSRRELGRIRRIAGTSRRTGWSAHQLRRRNNASYAVDPPPDIAVEIDVHHDTRKKFGIYAALGIPELWHYDEERLSILQLEQGEYVAQERSLALPMLTSEILSDYFTRLREEGEFKTILAFDEWLASNQG